MKRLLIPFLALGIGMASINSQANEVVVGALRIVNLSPDFLSVKQGLGVVGVVAILLSGYLLGGYMTKNDNVIQRMDEIFGIPNYRNCLIFGAYCLFALDLMLIYERLVKPL